MVSAGTKKLVTRGAPVSRAVTDKASEAPSGRGQSGGTAGSTNIDNPDRRMGQLPIATDGDPSSSPDVTQSRMMQNVMGDDDKEWYAQLFKAMSDDFLKPRFTVRPGFEVGLNCGPEPRPTLDDGQDHDTSSYGVFLPVPPAIARRIEAIYPQALTRQSKDDSPLHVTVLFIGDLSDEQATVTRGVCRAVMANLQPFQLGLGSTSHFDNPDASVFHLQVHAPELDELHHVLKSALGAAGIPVKHGYGPDGQGEFTPHITLAYLPPGEQGPTIQLGGSWLVDRMEMWCMDSPSLLRLGQKCCLRCTVGVCSEHVEGKGEDDDLILEPDAADTEEPKVDEFSSIGGGAIQGYTLPLGMSNQTKRQRRKRLKQAARTFGGGSFVGRR